MKGQHNMTAILVTGYRSFDLGIFKEKDARIDVIKRAISKDLIAFIESGVDWFIFTGNLGFEYWALEVAKQLQADYPIQIATVFLFENHGEQWNEGNQQKLADFKTVDFVKYSFKHYENPSQFKQYNQFIIENTDGAYLFYDNENETNMKYLVAQMSEKRNYDMHFLTFERLNEINDEE